MNRIRALSAALGIAAFIASVGNPLAARAADQAHTLSVRLDWLPSGYHAPFWLAIDKGWFKDAGLDVTIADGNGSVTTIQLVGNGQYDLGHAALATMAIARSKGIPIVSIAGFLRKGDTALMVPVDSPIHGPKDLKGKKIIYTAGSLETPFIEPFLAAGGLSSTDVNLLNVDAANKVAQYLGADSDGIISAAESLALLNKRPSRLILFADYGLNLPSFGLVASQNALKNKGPAIKEFASIVSGAWGYLLKGHEDEGIAAIIHNHESNRLDAGIVRANLDIALQFLYSPSTKDLPIGMQAESDWKDAIAIMEKEKVIAPGSKPTDYFTDEYIDQKTVAAIAAK
jgi:NitT/TauT family transport system substrate-binding protein